MRGSGGDGTKMTLGKSVRVEIGRRRRVEIGRQIVLLLRIGRALALVDVEVSGVRSWALVVGSRGLRLALVPGAAPLVTGVATLAGVAPLVVVVALVGGREVVQIPGGGMILIGGSLLILFYSLV